MGSIFFFDLVFVVAILEGVGERKNGRKKLNNEFEPPLAQKKKGGFFFGKMISSAWVTHLTIKLI